MSELGGSPDTPAERVRDLLETLSTALNLEAAVTLEENEEGIRGVLEGDDSYTLRLRIPGHDATALVYKHSIAYLVPDTGPKQS